MKCIQCYTDNNLQDRTANAGRCSNCNHAFVFEPTSMKDVNFTDPFFAKAIVDISVNNTLFLRLNNFFIFLTSDLKITDRPWLLLLFCMFRMVRG